MLQVLCSNPIDIASTVPSQLTVTGIKAKFRLPPAGRPCGLVDSVGTVKHKVPGRGPPRLAPKLADGSEQIWPGVRSVPPLNPHTH